MLKFFRQLRQRLLAENRIGRYLLYAAGEIILVMIGILLALQVNNWNEARKKDVSEKESLAELILDLDSGIASLENDVRLNKKLVRFTNDILNALSGGTGYTDSIGSKFGALVFTTTVSVNTSGYDNLKNTGLGIIKNDSLRKAITEFYENQVDFLQQYEEQDRQFTKAYFVPNYLPYFETVEAFNQNPFVGSRFTPFNFDHLNSDSGFRRLLSYLVLTKQELILNLNLTIRQMTELKNHVESYFNKIQ